MWYKNEPKKAYQRPLTLTKGKIKGSQNERLITQ